MKRVVFSQRVDVITNRNETRDSIDQKLIDFIIAADGLPIPIPNSLAAHDMLIEWLETLKPNAIVLSGGNDIRQAQLRDHTEEVLLQFAKTRILPVLGICRGMQMMAVSEGVKLKPVSGHVRSRHKLVGAIDGIDVNSYHEFGLSECPKQYQVIASAEDGEIEAIQHDNLPWQGWMWHPERETTFCLKDVKRAKDLFNEGNHTSRRSREPDEKCY